jgi:hypothetical protein
VQYFTHIFTQFHRFPLISALVRRQKTSDKIKEADASFEESEEGPSMPAEYKETARAQHGKLNKRLTNWYSGGKT